MRCILPNYDGAPAGYSHFTLNGRPFKGSDAVCTRLAEAATGEHRRVTRNIFMALCQLFREGTSSKNSAEPPSADKNGYGQGWEDAHAMVYGLAIRVLGGPLYNNAPQPEPSVELVAGDAKPFVTAMRTIARSAPESLAETGHPGDIDRGRQQKLSEGSSGNHGPSSLDRQSNAEKTEPRNADKTGSTRMSKDDKEEGFWLEETLSSRFSAGSNDEVEEDSMSLASQASSTPINTPSAVSISDSVLRALATPPPSTSSSSSKPSPSTPSCSKPSRSRPGRPDGSLKRSEIIRGLDTTALLTHFERQSRLAERRIAAELARTSILRQAILQDRFFGRVPSFVGTPDARDPVEGRSGAEEEEEEDDDDNEDNNAGVTNEINDPFLGEAQQDRAVREVKTLFRQWRKAAADATMDAGVLDEGIRTTEGEGEEDDNSTRPVENSVIPYLGPEVSVAGRGENAAVPSPRSESVYSSESTWLTGSPQRFTASPERFDEASPPMSPCMKRQYRLMIDHFASRNAYSSSSSPGSDHGH
ncbi:Amidohydrolase [Colletotrichum higginsianum IMI 349063]|uniref:Amidohydrolase n=2 Tax=Colletotrichum higginsianum (strain IMI 349063) TaxID=759273 RepID=A0A1B7XX01_COLHI|nr:Amidohydrolase [Colletotrichum higginsianum IMI 349063]OBR04296.1 Amidohydrolase [Colletotrichum higginsianum IMI 349063]